jgi:RNA polymerase sigma factor (sigma-70 family)
MPTDDDLLAAFRAGDDDAFADLVRRHGGMVFGVCTRILGSRHDAEDAFQATFLVLARRADAVRPADQLGRWLYGVARRVALKARARRERRRVVEAMAGEPDRPAESTGVPENLWRVLDEEAARLPTRLLSPFVLCDLEGLSYREAARQLGLAEGTLSNRLAAARRRLAGWLTRRGVTLPAAGLTVALTPAPAPAQLIASTADAAADPGYSTPLAEGVLKTMTLTRRIKTAATIALVLGLGGAAASVLYAQAVDPEMRRLEGTWTVVRAERSGKAVPAAELKHMTVTIARGKLTVRSGEREEVAAVTLDPTPTPRGIDLRPQKGGGPEPERGIYALEGDQLTLCWAAEAAPGERTKEFRTTPERGGRLLVLARVQLKGK